MGVRLKLYKVSIKTGGEPYSFLQLENKNKLINIDVILNIKNIFFSFIGEINVSNQMYDSSLKSLN